MTYSFAVLKKEFSSDSFKKGEAQYNADEIMLDKDI